MVMEYQKIISLSENAPNQPNKCRTKNCVKINDKSRGTYNTNSQTNFKNSMLRSRLCNYRDVDILVSGTIIMTILAAGRGEFYLKFVLNLLIP